LSQGAPHRFIKFDSTTGSEGENRFWAISTKPRITLSRLLKSWATPPASLPTASSFWDCNSWEVNSFRLVISRKIQTWVETSLLSFHRTPKSASGSGDAQGGPGAVAVFCHDQAPDFFLQFLHAQLPIDKNTLDPFFLDTLAAQLLKRDLRVP